MTSDVSGSTAPTATISVEKVLILYELQVYTDFSGLTITGVEILDGQGSRTKLTPAEIDALGFTQVTDIVFELAATGESGATFTGADLVGDYDVAGSAQADTITTNDANNTITVSSGDIVAAGAGDDAITAIISDYPADEGAMSSNFFAVLQVEIDGGVGQDTVLLSSDIMP